LKKRLMLIICFFSFILLTNTWAVDVSGVWGGTMTVTDKGSGQNVFLDDEGKPTNVIPIWFKFENGNFTCYLRKLTDEGEDYEKVDEHTHKLRRFTGTYKITGDEIQMKFKHGGLMGYAKGTFTGTISENTITGTCKWIIGAALIYEDKLKFDFGVTKQ